METQLLKREVEDLRALLEQFITELLSLDELITRLTMESTLVMTRGLVANRIQGANALNSMVVGYWSLNP